VGFAFGRVILVHAFKVRRAKVRDLALVAALNPSYWLAGLIAKETSAWRKSEESKKQTTFDNRRNLIFNDVI